MSLNKPAKAGKPFDSSPGKPFDSTPARTGAFATSKLAKQPKDSKSVTLPSQRELIRRLIKRSNNYALWLDVIAQADCRHVGYGTAHDAGEVAVALRKESDLWLELLSQDKGNDLELKDPKGASDVQ